MPTNAESPKVEPRKCERCGKALTKVMYDGGLKEWLCHWCWANTPIPKGKP